MTGYRSIDRHGVFVQCEKSTDGVPGVNVKDFGARNSQLFKN